MKLIKSHFANHPDLESLRGYLDSVLTQYDRVAEALKAGMKAAPPRYRHKASVQVEALDAVLDRAVTRIEIAMQKERLCEPEIVASLSSTINHTAKRVRAIRHTFEFDAFPGFDPLVTELLAIGAALDGLSGRLNNWLINVGNPNSRETNPTDSASSYSVAA